MTLPGGIVGTPGFGPLPTVPDMGPNFDYGALERALNTVEGQNLPPEIKARMLAAIQQGKLAAVRPPEMAASDAAAQAARGPGDLGQVLQSAATSMEETAKTGLLYAPWQFASDFTAGIIPGPDSEKFRPQFKEEWDSTIRPLVGLTAIGAQVWSIGGLLSFGSKAPVAARVLEALPARLKAIGVGTIVGGVTDAARPADYIPAEGEASGWDVPAWMGQTIGDLSGIESQRTQLALGGALFGGAAGEIIGGIMSGFQKARTGYVALRMDEPTLVAMRDALRSAGIEVVEGEGRFAVAEKFVRNMRKVALNENLAGLVSERLSREDYILSELATSANSAQAGDQVAEETGRLVAGIFRTNPGGVAVVTNLTDPSLVNIRMPKPNRAGDIDPFPLTGNKVPVIGGRVEIDDSFIHRPKDSELLRILLFTSFDAKDVAKAARQGVTIQAGEPIIPWQYQANIQRHMWSPTATNKNIFDEVERIAAAHPQWIGNDIAADLVRKYAKKRKFDPMAEMPEWSEWEKTKTISNAQLLVRQQLERLTGRAAPTTNQVTEKWIVGRNTRAAAHNEGKWRVTHFDDANSPEPAGHVWFDTQDAAELYAKKQGAIQTQRSLEARKVQQSGLVFEASKKLGMKLDVHVVRRTNPKALGPGIPSPTYDILVARPVYEFVPAKALGKLNAKVTESMKALARETAQSVRASKTTEAFILSDGTPIRGGLRTTDLEKRLHLQSPIVEGVPRPDLALRSAAQPVRMDLVAPKELVIELPAKLSQEQFNALGRSLDAVKMDKVILKAGDQTRELLTPLGGQLQDAIVELVKPKSVRNFLTRDMIDQFEKTGIFRGQAAVLPDGTAGEIIGGAGGKPGSRLFRVKESLTGETVVMSEKQITLLPTTLSSELQPNQLFTQYLDQGEREALARIRFAVGKGWAKELKTARQLKDFGNSRGFVVTALRGGKFELTKVNDSGADPILFPNLKSAVEFIRRDQSAMPDLTPQGLSNILGENLNLGWVGGGGHTPNMNEMVPINWENFSKSLESLPSDRGTTVWDSLIRPTKALMEQVDKRFDLQFTKAFENIASSMVGKQNFESLWYQGKGGKLPAGVKPLQKIFDEAGNKADWEKVTDWRETPKGTPEAQAIWDSMTPGEQKAADDLANWYNAAYIEFGVEAPFVENYMPHMRELAERGNGTDLITLWRMMGGDPLKPPKGMDWVSDMVREGNMDIYEKDARKVAAMYLRGAGHSRYMKQAYDEAREMVMAVASKNKQLGGIMGHFLQAVRGTEFPEQRAVMSETFKRILEKLPGEKHTSSAAAAERMVDLLNGAVYASTQGFRPSLALRNASSALVMVWPVYGSNGRFSEALLRAMTMAGKDEAVAARAISHSQGARFAQSEVDEAMREVIPRKLQEANELGMSLYDSADQFTRAVAFHAAKIRAEEAIAVFAKKVTRGLAPNKVEAAKRELLVESRMFLQDKQIADEFLRRVGLDPNNAATFAGKQASDVVNFLYGRGMQAQWMRSVGGRLFGQFGTWPMWYIDYLRRMVGRAGMQGFRKEGMQLLFRHALVNGAILAAGHEVLDIDLSRWASYGSVFWSGGPGFQIASGASTLMRGLGSVTSVSEDPLAQSRVSEGMQMIWQTMPTYVPFYFGTRDAIRLLNSENSTEFLASVMGTKPTREFQFQDRMNRLLGVRDDNKPFTASSPAIEDLLNARAAGQQALDIRGIAAGTTPTMPAQTGGQQVQSQSRSASVSMPANTPPDVRANLMNEVQKSAESKPIGNY